MAKEEQNGGAHDLKSLLSSKDRDFFVRNNGDKVKIDDLKGKITGLYFSASWCGPCKRFTPKLIEVYNELCPEKDFEVIFLSSDRDEQSFNDYFSKMPWLAIPFTESEIVGSLKILFNVEGIPSLVILDGNGKVLNDDARDFIDVYGVEGYPFSPERIKYFKEKEEKAKMEQTLDSILVSGSHDFLIANDGNQVPVSELEGKIVGLYFHFSSFGPCDDFTQQLMEVYGKLKDGGDKFEVVLISLDQDEEVFNETIKGMPWLALPFQDNTKLVRYFELSALPTLVIIGPDGKTIHPNAAELIEECGTQAYPFAPENVLKLEEMKKAKAEAQTLESILVSGDRDFLLAKDGTKVLVSELVGKNILLYFSAHWCPPCRAFTPKLIEAYHDIKAKDDAFEVIFISSDRDQPSFEEYYSSMPWLALPFGDERKKSLSRTFKISGIPAAIAIGPSGQTVSENARDLLMTHGANAYPFTDEEKKEEDKDTENDVKEEKGAENDVKEENGEQAPKKEPACDGDVCYRT